MFLLRRHFLKIPAVIAVFCVSIGSSAPSRAAGPDLDLCLAFDRDACDRVLAAEPGQLTAQFMRGLAAELAGDNAAALQDFDAVATREPRHFGAQLWRHIAALSLRQTRAGDLQAYLAGAKQLGPWPRVLAELYLGEKTADDTLTLARTVTGPAAVEALCAAEYHAGRAAFLAGRADEATAHFRAALASGATHVFEYQAAQRAVNGAN